ncbi:putative ABC transporter B family member 16 [Cocos nucifera]|uniref:Putative ABC transporter B family member 16 n=1 Tax=Cocos nucifera TaxID=13894 RepID=A0A8K0N4E0_COCNU|nr:putative ABC transporter B family member 16 [Cocos nucifera]
MELSTSSSNEPRHQSDPQENSVSRSQANEQAFSLFFLADRFPGDLWQHWSPCPWCSSANFLPALRQADRLIGVSLSRLASEVSKHVLQLAHLGLLVMAKAWIVRPLFTVPIPIFCWIHHGIFIGMAAYTTLAIVPLVVIAGGTNTIIMSSLSRKGEAAYAEAGKVAEEVISHIHTVRSYVGEERAIEAYSRSLETSLKFGKKSGLAKGLGLGCTYGYLFCSWALLLWYAGILVTHGVTNGGKTFTTILNVVFSGFALGQAAPNLSSFTKGRAAAKNILSMIAKIPERSRTSENGMEYLLGKVMSDGHDIKNIQLKWLRSQMGVVSQEPALFSTSIAENIIYGRKEADIEEIVEAAKVANAHSFIQDLPDGYLTKVGMQLAGGQKQRIAIARALLRNPKILLLHEATSALDAESECLVQHAMEKVMLNKTTVIVAPRLSTISNADTIIVLKNGKIAESGTHMELISKGRNGEYAKLVTTQVPVNNKERHPDYNESAVSSGTSPNVPEDELNYKKMNSVIIRDQESQESCGPPRSASISSIWTVFKLNKSEWSLAIQGSVGATLAGVEAILENEIGWFELDENSSGSLTSSWRMTFVIVATFPLLISASIAEGFGGKYTCAYARANSVAQEAITNNQTVAAFGAEDQVLSNFKHELHQPSRQAHRRGHIFGVGYDFSNIMKSFMVLIVTALGVAETLALTPDIVKGSQALCSVFSLLEQKTTMNPDDPKSEKVVEVKGDIEFRNVSFAYPTRPHVTVLKDLNLHVAAGRSLTLVGRSGSGKSSVIALVMRFYDTSCGAILIDGKDIRDLNLRSLRQRIGFVQQEPALFSTTVYENIAYGKEDASEIEILRAAKAANAHGFISRLAEGYNTHVGARGAQLSGGQRQRVAIA